MKTAVVILNWNGRKFLERFVPGILESLGDEAQLIIADNASSDGSAEMLKDRFPDVPVMLFSQNRGFTGGYNRALMELEAEYFVLLNSDIEVPRHWLEPLEEWMDTHPECGICAPKLHSFADREMFEYAGAAGGYIDRFGYPYCRGRVMKFVEEDRGQYDSPENVFWVSGACLVIRADLYRKLGGLDERFFAHMEEIDLCWRAQLAGYRVTVVPQSTVWHIGGGSLPNNSPRKLYLNYRNNLLMLRKNLGKTMALKLFQSGRGKRESIASGHRKASRTIFTRMILDGLSCAVYIASFKWKYAQAVIKAHNDFRKFKVKETEADISSYLKLYGKTGHIDGLSRSWIIPKTLIYRKRIFRKLSSGQ